MHKYTQPPAAIRLAEITYIKIVWRGNTPPSFRLSTVTFFGAYFSFRSYFCHCCLLSVFSVEIITLNTLNYPRTPLYTPGHDYAHRWYYFDQILMHFKENYWLLHKYYGYLQPSISFLGWTHKEFPWLDFHKNYFFCYVMLDQTWAKHPKISSYPRFYAVSICECPRSLLGLVPWCNKFQSRLLRPNLWKVVHWRTEAAPHIPSHNNWKRGVASNDV